MYAQAHSRRSERGDLAYRGFKRKYPRCINGDGLAGFKNEDARARNFVGQVKYFRALGASCSLSGVLHMLAPTKRADVSEAGDGPAPNLIANGVSCASTCVEGLRSASVYVHTFALEKLVGMPFPPEKGGSCQTVPSRLFDIE